MARLSNFHMLCPLIDQSNFLGVVGDSSNDCVVVTLGRNIVIRYKITDRKQVGSWSTREKLTSPAIYDPVGCQYVAVFNHKQIRIWKQEDEDLDTIKKYKFPEEIHSLLVSSGTKAEPAILFKSGRICKLSNFLSEKGKVMEIWKQQERSRLNPILRADETLEDWCMITCQTVTYVILSTRTLSRHKNPNFYMMKLMKDDDEYSLHRRFTLQLREAWLVGHTVIQHTESCSLLTLWSNGKIYRLNLDSYVVDDVSTHSISEPSKIIEAISPGSVIDSVKELFDVENKVALVALGPDHIALYGADSCQKGAVVYIVDVHSSATGDLPWEALKESAAKQCLKNSNAKEVLPRVWNAAGHLFIPSSDGRLVLASYELGSHTPLADLIGCLGKKATIIKSNGMLHQHTQLQQGSWLKSLSTTQEHTNEKEKVGSFSQENNMPHKVHAKLKPLIEKGLPESRICRIIFPELMNDADDESISWCLSHFSDIPEESLVNLLYFFLNRNVTTPTCKNGDSHKKVIRPIPDRNSVMVTSQKDSSKHAETISSTQPMMNGDISEPMDSTSCDGDVDESERNDNFEIGHVFVKGRRRSLRVMKTPQKEPLPSKVNNSARRMLKLEGKDSQDMVVETSTSPKCLAGKDRKRNSILVVNGLDVIEEGKKIPSSESEKMEVDTVTSHGDGRPSENKVQGSSCKEKSSVLTESTIERMALPHGQRKPVEKLLSVPVSSFILLPALRSKLPFQLALKLIRHLLWLLSSSEAAGASSPSEGRLVEWICHLLDAFYQQYTLSQDDDVMDTLKAVKEVLDIQIRLIDALKEMEPLLLQLKSGKIVKESTCDKWYSIENIRLY